jgi:signal transduction histidine kinase
MGEDRLSERRDTDQHLDDERRRTDEKFEERQRLAADHSDKLLAAARQQRDVMLAEMRAQEDRGVGESTSATVAQTDGARRLHDSDVARQRAEDDRQLLDDRAERRALFAALLADHRARTDASLRLERSRVDATIESHDNFLGVVSHDVRGMVASISLSSEAILRALNDPAQCEAAKRGVERIRLAASHIDSMVRDLLDVAAIAAGQFIITPIVRDLAAVVQDAVDIVQPLAAERAIEVDASGLEEPILAPVDERRILQVLANLLGNAIKFSDRASKIHVELRCGGRGVECSVADFGPGIDDASRETIFERFRRGTRSAVDGAGLGLHIAKAIVEAHGGRIWVESRVGVGSTFHFTVPAVAQNP